MFNVLDLKVWWYKDYSNLPSLILLVDSAEEEFVWEKKTEDGLYFGEESSGRFFKHLFHSGKPKQQNGYGGTLFSLKMKDGSKGDLHGPWFGSVSDYGDCGFLKEDYMDIAIADKSSKFNSHYHGFCIKVDYAKELLGKFAPSLEVYKEKNYIQCPVWSIKEKNGFSTADMDNFVLPSVENGKHEFEPGEKDV